MILEELSERAVTDLVDEEELKKQAAIIDTRNELSHLLSTQRWKKLWKMPMLAEMVDVLPQEDRELLYLTHGNQNLWVGVGLNVIPGLYLGSWVQGDRTGALIGYAHSIAAFAVANALVVFWVDDPYIDADGYYHKYAKPEGIGWLSIGAIGASYVVGLLQPVLYVRRWNRRLANRLDVDPDRIGRDRSTVAFAPPKVEMTSLGSGELRIKLKLVSLSY